MRKALTPTRRWARILAAAVLAMGVAGVATAVHATIPDGAGVIHGCYSANGAHGTNGTQLNILDGDAAACSKGQTEITWNQQGPKGDTGPSDAYVKDQRNSFSTIHILGSGTTILTLGSLPPGSYIVNASAAIASDGGTTQCFLTSGGGQSLSSAFQSTSSSFDVIPLTSAFTFAATDSINIVCAASGTNTFSQPSVIVATRVGALH